MVLQVSLKKTADSWRCHHWFPGEMTSENRAQKFHTDDASLSRSGQCFWLVEANFPHRTINQKRIEFLRFISRRKQEPVVSSQNVGCLLLLLSGQLHDCFVLGRYIPPHSDRFVLFSLVAPKICKTALCYEISKGLWYLLHYLKRQIIIKPYIYVTFLHCLVGPLTLKSCVLL